MWVKRNSKTIFLDLTEYFLNLGNIEEHHLKRIVTDTKFNEIIRLPLPKQAISDIQEAFTILDWKSRGIVGARDVKVTLRALGIEPTAKKVKKLMDKTFHKKSGKDLSLGNLSREDYEKMLIHIIHDIDSDEQMIKSFRLFDTDKSGEISKDELRKIATQLELDVTDEEIQEMMNIAANGDGRVTEEEFINTARKIF